MSSDAFGEQAFPRDVVAGGTTGLAEHVLAQRLDRQVWIRRLLRRGEVGRVEVAQLGLVEAGCGVDVEHLAGGAAVADEGGEQPADLLGDRLALGAARLCVVLGHVDGDQLVELHLGPVRGEHLGRRAQGPRRGQLPGEPPEPVGEGLLTGTDLVAGSGRVP
jgi:hypothetical protein